MGRPKSDWSVRMPIRLSISDDQGQKFLLADVGGYYQLFELTKNEFVVKNHVDSIITARLKEAELISYMYGKCVIQPEVFDKLRESTMIFYFLEGKSFAEVFITQINSYSRKVQANILDGEGLKQGMIYTEDNVIKRVIGNIKALEICKANLFN